MSAVANGADANRQEASIVTQVNVATPIQDAPQSAPDSAVRLPIGSPGNQSGLNQQAAGSSAYLNTSAGQKNLL